MARRVVALVSACLGAALLPARAGDPVEPLRLERLLGPDVIACARIDTRLASWEGPVRATAMGRLVALPEVAEALAPLGRAAREAFAPASTTPGDDGPIPATLRWVASGLEGLSGELAVAWRDGDAGGAPRVAALLDFGPRLSHAVAFLERARARLAAGAPEVVAAARNGDSTWSVRTGSDGAITVAVLGTALLVSTDEAWLHGVVAEGLVVGKPPTSLADAPPFTRLRRRTGGDDAVAWAYVDLALLRERLGDGEPWLPGPLDDVLGLRAWRAAGYGLAFDGDRVVERVALDAPRAGGLLALFAQGPGPSVGLDLAPRSTLLHAELGAGLAEGLGRAMALLEALDPDEAADVRRYLDGLRGATGVDLERDLLARFTGRQAAWVALPPTGGLAPEVALVARVREPEAFERALARLVDEWLARATEVGDVLAASRTLPGPAGSRLHVIDLDRPAGAGVAPFTPTWAVVGDRLIVTLVPHALREILAREASGEPALDGTPDGAGLRAPPVPGSGDDRAAVVHLDTRAALRCLYDTGAPLVQGFAGLDGLALPRDFDPAALPATRTVAPFLPASRVSLLIDADGADLSCTAPAPALALTAAGVLLGRLLRPPLPPPPAPVEMPAASVRDDPAAETSRALAAVAAALREHRARLGGWPERLDDLVKRSRLLAAVPVDGWGRDLGYDVGPSPGAVRIRSVGRDGRPDTADDLFEEVEAGDR